MEDIFIDACTMLIWRLSLIHGVGTCSMAVFSLRIIAWDSFSLNGFYLGDCVCIHVTSQQHCIVSTVLCFICRHCNGHSTSV